MVQVEKATEIEDLINDPNFNINDWYGYVYITLHLKTGKEYIGKKAFWHSKTKKLGKKELLNLPVTRGRKPTSKKTIIESDWKTYYGSADEVKSLPKEELKRYLLKLCKTKKELTYWETKLLFSYGVLEDDKYINNNILGSFFKTDFLK